LVKRHYSEDFSTYKSMFVSESFIEAGSYAAIALNQIMDPDFELISTITDIHAEKNPINLQAADILAGLLYGVTEEFNLEGLSTCLESETFV
jgi:hypothetical protein